jgi:hypothetical protein
VVNEIVGICSKDFGVNEKDRDADRYEFFANCVTNAAAASIKINTNQIVKRELLGFY